MSIRAGRLSRMHTALFRAAAAGTALFIAVTVILMVTHTRLQPVLTGSMSPAIPQYSLVLATPVRAADLRVGDVAVFQPPAGDVSVMHRVVELREENGVPIMRTRGDANAAADPWTIDLRSSALSRVQAHLPYIGVAVQFLHNTTRHTGGMLTWPGLLILIGVAGYAVRIRRRPPAPIVEPAAFQQISEELRNPLSSIVGYTELLAEEETLDPAHARVVETIARQARRLADLADDISILQSLEVETPFVDQAVGRHALDRPRSELAAVSAG